VRIRVRPDEHGLPRARSSATRRWSMTIVFATITVLLALLVVLLVATENRRGS